MNDIGRGQMDTDNFVNRDVQIIVELHVVRRAQSAIRPGINDFPVKLLRGNLKLKVAVRRVALYLSSGRDTHE